MPAGATVADALRRIEKEFPDLGGQVKNCRVAVDEEFTREEHPLNNLSVLAIIPPVSGG